MDSPSEEKFNYNSDDDDNNKSSKGWSINYRSIGDLIVLAYQNEGEGGKDVGRESIIMFIVKFTIIIVL